jgi:hypothetical protein
MEINMEVLQKSKIELPYDPTIQLGYVSEGTCPTYNRDTCTFIFIAALFIMPTLWNQTRCPTTDEWIKKI